MPQKVTKTSIDGDRFLIVEDGVTIVDLPSKDLADGFFGTGFPRSGILPPAVRWASSDHTGFLVERPPFVATLSYIAKPKREAGKIDDGSAERQLYQVPLPWQVYALKFADPTLKELAYMKVYCRTAAIGGDQDVLSVLPLPNMLDQTTPCLGPDFEAARCKLADPTDPYYTVAKALNSTLGAFWSAGFNMDTEIFARWLPSLLKNEYHDDVRDATKVLTTWERTTIPEVMTWDWVPVMTDSGMPQPFTVKNIMKILDTELWKEYKASYLFLNTIAKRAPKNYDH